MRAKQAENEYCSIPIRPYIKLNVTFLYKAHFNTSRKLYRFSFARNVQGRTIILHKNPKDIFLSPIFQVWHRNILRSLQARKSYGLFQYASLITNPHVPS